MNSFWQEKISIFFTFFFVILSVFFLQNCSNSKAEKEKINNKVIKPEKTKVDAIIIDENDFDKELHSNGKISSAETTDIVFRRGGQIKKINIRKGQFVKQGTLLAELNLEKIQIDIEKAKIRVAKAKNNFENILIGQGYNQNDSSKIPSQIISIALIKSNYSSELLNLKEAKQNFNLSFLKAPFSGIIADIKKQKYNTVSQGDVLCKLINNNKFQVTFPLFETDRKKIHQGQKIQVITLNNDTLLAKLSQINPIINNSGQFEVTASIIASKKIIMQGMSVDIIIKNKITKQLAVPRTAVVNRQNKDIVFTVHNRKAKWNYVNILAENSKYIAIKKGLEKGDTVVISNNINLAHDTELEINIKR